MQSKTHVIKGKMHGTHCLTDSLLRGRISSTFSVLRPTDFTSAETLLRAKFYFDIYFSTNKPKYREGRTDPYTLFRSEIQILNDVLVVEYLKYSIL